MAVGGSSVGAQPSVVIRVAAAAFEMARVHVLLDFGALFAQYRFVYYQCAGHNIGILLAFSRCVTATVLLV